MSKNSFNRILLAKTLINKTHRPLRMYHESTGDYTMFSASDKKLPVAPKQSFGIIDTGVYYVYTMEQFERLKANMSWRSLDDIAVVTDGEHFGRGHKRVDTLLWAKDMQTHICYRGK